MDNKNISAFPCVIEMNGGFHEHYPGMTLRDWFAGQALSLIGSADLKFKNSCELGERDVAEAAYLIADAMLAAREK